MDPRINIISNVVVPPREPRPTTSSFRLIPNAPTTQELMDLFCPPPPLVAIDNSAPVNEEEDEDDVVVIPSSQEVIFDEELLPTEKAASPPAVEAPQKTTMGTSKGKNFNLLKAFYNAEPAEVLPTPPNVPGPAAAPEVPQDVPDNEGFDNFVMSSITDLNMLYNRLESASVAHRNFVMELDEKKKVSVQKIRNFYMQMKRIKECQKALRRM